VLPAVHAQFFAADVKRHDASSVHEAVSYVDGLGVGTRTTGEVVGVVVGWAVGTVVGASVGAGVAVAVGAAVGLLVEALVGAAVGLQLAVNVESMIHDEPSQYFQVPSASLRSDGVLSSE
jgi:outer membrane lipoprotein SlyB